MTEANEDKMTDSGEDARRRWVGEVQEALDRTGDALRTAWGATRESRMSALESAKQAAKELGEVIDQGITAAKERWSAADLEDDTQPMASAPESEEAATEVTVEPSDAGTDRDTTEQI